jgi:hypothetical protein
VDLKKRAAGSSSGDGVDPEAAAHAMVARWTNDVDIFTKKYIAWVSIVVTFDGRLSYLFVICFLVQEMFLRFLSEHSTPLVLVLSASLATTPCNRFVLVPIVERLHCSTATICNLDFLRQ